MVSGTAQGVCKRYKSADQFSCYCRNLNVDSSTLYWSSSELSARIDKMLGGLACSQETCHGDVVGRSAFLQFVCSVAHTRCPTGASEGQSLMFKETTRVCRSSCVSLRDTFYNSVTNFFTTNSVARMYLQQSTNKSVTHANEVAAKLIPLVCQAEFPIDCDADTDLLSSDSATCTQNLSFVGGAPFARIAECLSTSSSSEQCDFANNFASPDIDAPLCDSSPNSKRPLQLRLRTDSVVVTLRSPTVIDNKKNIFW